VLAAVKLVRKARLKLNRKNVEPRYEDCQRGAFKNCLRYGVPDGM